MNACYELTQRLYLEWATELEAYFGHGLEDWGPRFPYGSLKIELMDGSFAQFQYAIYIVSVAKKTLAVFTEHCGYHLYPLAGVRIYRDGVLVYQQEGSLASPEATGSIT